MSVSRPLDSGNRECHKGPLSEVGPSSTSLDLLTCPHIDAIRQAVLVLRGRPDDRTKVSGIYSVPQPRRPSELPISSPRDPLPLSATDPVTSRSYRTWLLLPGSTCLCPGLPIRGTDRPVSEVGPSSSSLDLLSYTPRTHSSLGPAALPPHCGGQLRQCGYGMMQPRSRGSTECRNPVGPKN